MNFKTISAFPKSKKAHKSYPTPISQKSVELSDRNGVRRLDGIMGNQAIMRLIQAKLSIGAPDDKYEQEADRVADHVMRMPEPNIESSLYQAPPSPLSGIQRMRHGSVDQLNRQAIEETIQNNILATKILPLTLQRQPEVEEEKEEEESIQTKQATNNSPSLTTDVQDKILSLKGRGQPMPASEQVFFEPRFGQDFSNVRIHTDTTAQESAKAINARAYTMGTDVVFGAGEYSPGTTASRHLLAHELTHVVQQAHGQLNTSSQDSINACVQRKLEVNAGVRLNMYGYTHTKTGNVYTAPRIAKSSIYHELFTSLLHSPRTFKIKGATNKEADKNYSLHRATRQKIVNFAAKKKYTFAAGSAFRMNPTYWQQNAAGTGWELKPGADRKKAIADLNVHPNKYKIACLAATHLTMMGGGTTSLVSNPSADQKDWVPGDWGYITNDGFTGATADVGLEGENIIYTGKGKFWGHFGPGNTYYTLQQWFNKVKSWNGSATIENTRKYPKNGLE